MPKPTFLYSTHARWYVCLCSRRASVHCSAVVVLTPSRGICFAELPETASPSDSEEAAAHIVARFYDEEDWYRLPNEIRCREQGLSAALRRVFDEVPVRTDRTARCFPDIEERFRSAG